MAGAPTPPSSGAPPPPPPHCVVTIELLGGRSCSSSSSNNAPNKVGENVVAEQREGRQVTSDAAGEPPQTRTSCVAAAGANGAPDDSSRHGMDADAAEEHPGSDGKSHNGTCRICLCRHAHRGKGGGDGGEDSEGDSSVGGSEDGHHREASSSSIILLACDCKVQDVAHHLALHRVCVTYDRCC